ncbi:MAG: hypothetical protein J5822_09685, partial [Eubacteriaceae bacterium]|nr:hypothetical protein [Eubacteriaceae bacterium]
ISIPFEDIRSLIQGKLSLNDCLEQHLREMNSRIRSDQIVARICSDMIGEGASFETIRTTDILSDMEDMESEGVRFLNVGNSDVKKRSRAAVTAGIIMMLLMAAMPAAVLLSNAADPVPWPVYPVIVGIPLVMVLGVFLALRERLNEINKGEEDEARKY